MTSRPRLRKSGVAGLRAVVDTNVWVSGLIVPQSPPGEVLRAVRERRIIPLASWELAEEIAEVLRRPELRRYRIKESDVVEILAVMAPFLPSLAVTAVPVPRDVKDLPVIATALAGKAEVIITGDRDLLADEQLRTWLASRRIRVLTPAAALQEP